MKLGKSSGAIRGGWIVAVAGTLVLVACGAARADRPPQTGDMRLTYAMAQAGGEQIPYRVYLPRAWNAKVDWPLVVILHGYAMTADKLFEESGDRLRAEAEKHGFVLVAPNGYNGMADYGANLPLPSSLSRFDQPLKMKPEKESALAEADVLSVLDRAIKDYNIDPERVYLMGNSMGMTGVLHFAEKTPEKWCAISPSDGPPWPDYPVERLKPIPGVLFVHGGKDDIAKLSDTQGLVDWAKAAGVNVSMHVVPEGTHGSAWMDYLPETMKFFASLNCDRAGGAGR